MAVSGAITWFFENEEMGIILEDDGLPSQSFFWFCEELLERYKDDMRIGQINGVRRFEQLNNCKENTYFFSRYGSIWGWATWKRAWNYYNVNLSNTIFDNAINCGMIDSITFSNEEKFKRKNIWKMVINNEIDTWDYQWGFVKFYNSLLSIVPKNNLIENIGFGEDATHTQKKSKNNSLLKNEIIFPLVHPSNVLTNFYYDKYFSEQLKSNKIKYILSKFGKPFR